MRKIKAFKNERNIFQSLIWSNLQFFKNQFIFQNNMVKLLILGVSARNGQSNEFIFSLKIEKLSFELLLPTIQTNSIYLVRQIRMPLSGLTILSTN